MLLIMFFIPVMLIYGIFKSILDAFRWKFLRKTYYLIPLVFIAQTDMSKMLDTLNGMLISIFYVILPAFFILLILKAFTKLVRV